MFTPQLRDLFAVLEILLQCICLTFRDQHLAEMKRIFQQNRLLCKKGKRYLVFGFHLVIVVQKHFIDVFFLWRNILARHGQLSIFTFTYFSGYVLVENTKVWYVLALAVYLFLLVRHFGPYLVWLPFNLMVFFLHGLVSVRISISFMLLKLF